MKIAGFFQLLFFFVEVFFLFLSEALWIHHKHFFFFSLFPHQPTANRSSFGVGRDCELLLTL